MVEIGYKWSDNVMNSSNKQRTMAYTIINAMHIPVVSKSIANTKSTPKERLRLNFNGADITIVISKDGVKQEV